MRRYLFLLFITCISANLVAQKRNNVWAFGDGAGLNFNTSPVSPFKSKAKATDPPYYLSSICSKSGDLLFYTDGNILWNRDNFVLPKYKNWWPWPGNVIPLIAPYIGNDSLYYIFGINDERSNGSPDMQLQYLTIKMYNPGDIEEAVYPRPVNATTYYTTLLDNTSHVLAGTGHCNQVDTWITTHSPGALYSFLITSTGVNPVPVITTVPSSVLPLQLLNAKYSNIKFSANGERLIIPENDHDKIVVYDFDNQTGRFSNPIVLSVPEGLTLEDIEISADGSKLYFGAYEVYDPEVSAELHYLYQMDLNAGSAAAIENTIYQLNFGDRVACLKNCYILRRTMQMGPDGRIYVGRREGKSISLDQKLGVVEEPSKAGRDASYKGTEVDLNVLPRFLNYNYIRSASFTPRENSIQFKKNNCEDQPVDFSLIFSRLDSVKWEFGDPQSGNRNFSRVAKPQHQYPGPGTYIVRAIIYNRCILDTATALVTIDKNKVVTVPASINDTVLCAGEDLYYNATAPFVTQYVWDNLSTNPERKIEETGTYSIIVLNDCSLDTKTFNVTFKECPCNSYIPNAFSPNYDGLNDLFRPVFDCTPKEYHFQVYDRYGTVVFRSGKLNEGWNGKKGQEQLAQGIYAWILNYRHPGTKKIISKKGTVMLLR